MKRTPMPARVVPLRPTPLASVTPIRRRRRRHAATGRKAAYADLTIHQRARLYTRAGGRCEGALTRDCWGPLPEDLWQAAHRQARGQGGDNTALWNRWAACAPCHRWQHDHSTAAGGTGHYVRSELDPHRMPMCLPDGRVVRLSADGLYLPVGGDAA